MPFIFAIRDFKAVFKGVKLQKIFGLTLLRGLKKRVLRDFIPTPHHLNTTTSQHHNISTPQHLTIYVTIRLKPHLNVVRSDY